MITEHNLVCPRCHNPLEGHSDNCQNCGLKVSVSERSLTYDADTILVNNHYRQFLLSKALNNNGFISYIELAEGSLSLAEREDVQRFRQFIVESLESYKGVLCDIGCGPMEKPGYISDELSDKFTIFGLDPSKNNNYFSYFIKGCGEYLPFADSSLDAIIFATSIDHVVELNQVIKESARVLRNKGRIIVWMSDKSKPKGTLWIDFKILAKKIIKWLKSPGTYRYIVYDNNTVFYRPPGAIDAFHTYNETPDFIINHFAKERFVLLRQDYNSRNEVFLLFELD